MGKTYRPVATLSNTGSGSYAPVPTSDDGTLPRPGASRDIDEVPPMTPATGKVMDILLPYASFWSFTTIIIIVDLIMFIATLVVGGTMYDGAFVKGNHSGGPSSLTLRGMGGKWEPSIYAGHVYLLITPIFLHAGVIHLLSNCLFQLRYGYLSEKRWGVRSVILVYFISGIGGSLLSCVGSRNVISVGASGALFGVFGANVTFLLYNWANIRGKEWEAVGLITVLVLNFGTGFVDQSIDHFAHIGGLTVGLACGLCIPRAYTVRPNEKTYRILGWVAVIAQLMAFSLLLWLLH